MALVCQRHKREYCAAWDAKRKTCGALYLGKTECLWGDREWKEYVRGMDMRNSK